jgi:hypothetical protein
MAKTWLQALVLGAATGVLLLAARSPARADQASGARFTVVEGSVTLHGQDGTRPAAPTQSVIPGDYVSTGP